MKTESASMSPSTSPCAATSTRREASTFPSRRPAMTTSSSADRFPTKRAPTPMTVRVSALLGSACMGTTVDSAFPNIRINVSGQQSVIGALSSTGGHPPPHRLPTADYRLLPDSSRIDLQRLLENTYRRAQILFVQH